VVLLAHGGGGGQAETMTSSPSGTVSSTASSPVVQRRVLAGELKNLRRSAGLTHVDVANRLGWQQGKVSKIESAKQRVGVEAVIALAEVCHATPEQRDRLIGLAHTARQKGWWESYGDVLPWAGRLYVGLEADAHRIGTFAVETVPDLLQTADYAKAALAARNPLDGGVERRLEVLLERQRAPLEQRTAEIDSVIAESALCRVVGGKTVLARQMRHLALMASSAMVRIRVLPFDAGAIPVDGPFTILGFRENTHPDIAFVPSQCGYTGFEQEAEVHSYAEALRALQSLSLSPAESIRYLDDRERELVS
jgi:transcriptional regulator with XRE-family HTH domain